MTSDTRPSPPDCPSWCDTASHGWLIDGPDITKTCRKVVHVDAGNCEAVFTLERFACIVDGRVTFEQPRFRSDYDDDSLPLPAVMHFAETAIRLCEIVSEAAAAA